MSLKNPILRINTSSYIPFQQQFKIILCFLVSFYPVSVFPDNQENLRILRERIQSLQKDLTDKETIKQNTSDILQKTERVINALNRKLANLSVNERQATDDFKQLQAQYQQIENEIHKGRNQLDELLYRQYLNGHQDFSQLMLKQQDPHQIARDIYYYKQLSLAHSGIIKNLLENQQKIKTLTHVSLQKKEEIAAIQTEYSLQHKKLEQEKSKYQTTLSQISGQITKQQQEISKLENDEKRITNLVIGINRLLAQEKSGITQINNKTPDVSTATSAPFLLLKGKLNLPVRGKLLNSFGGQRSGKHVVWKGLFIQSAMGNDVKAIAEGRVVFADWLRGFGNLIILDHGNAYMSLYGNNATLLKQVGNFIRGGDTIATVGNSGANVDSGLYFELRYKGKPFDPLTWVKVE